jgi:hypothetical protein
MTKQSFQCSHYSEAQLQLTSEIAQLLSMQDNERLHWSGSITDIIEALYLAYETRMLCGGNGLPLTFTTMVRCATRLLQLPQLKNPFDTAARGRRRKGILSDNYLTRYRRLLDEGKSSPLMDSITL